MEKKIVALIRTHEGREGITDRAIQSCIDNGVDYLVKRCPTYPDGDYGYNLHCNEMKAEVNEGWFFFLDSDDYILDGAMNHIKRFLREDEALIVQMLRNGRKKPLTKSMIGSGKIGLPCLVLHSKHKYISDLTGEGNGDWKWIEGVMNAMKYRFVPIPLVDAGQRNRGK